MKKIGIVDQVRTAFSKNHRMATMIGCLLGGFVPLATYSLAHIEVTRAPWVAFNPLIVLIVGGLVYSAQTVYQWGKMAFSSKPKALGFTVLLEGVMTLSAQTWLSIAALALLCSINAIATGTTLTQGVKVEPVATEELARNRKVRALKAV